MFEEFAYPMSNMPVKSNSSLVRITSFFAAVSLVSNICLHAFAFPPAITYWIMGGTAVVLIGLFLVNLALAVFYSGRRISHLLLAVLVAVVFVGGMAISSLIGDAQARWFLTIGKQQYEAMVAKVNREKSSLNSESRPLDSIVGRTGVWGRTNEDGSVLIIFQGVDTYMRSHRLYYSGNRMKTQTNNSNIYFFPDNPNNLYVRITNDWYVHLRN
jgi:hypothetical protein